MNIFLTLTEQFNAGRLRAVICSGQAAVLHRVAIMSKDGDWVLREEAEAAAHVLGVLGQRGARYRFGAPLDPRWLAGGWSAHFELRHESLRVRTDFFSRPPRVSPEALSRLWRDQEGKSPPFVDLVTLAELKKTNREKDYVVIGELARLMTTVEDRLRYSRSARDVLELAQVAPEVFGRIARERPVIAAAHQGLAALEAALDAERRELIHRNEVRLGAYLRAAAAWTDLWPQLGPRLGLMPLGEAHAEMVNRASGVLPFELEDARDA